MRTSHAWCWCSKPTSPSLLSFCHLMRKANCNLEQIKILYLLLLFSLQLFAHLFHSLTKENLYLARSRTIDHAMCTFNLPTEYKAQSQEHILDDDDKVKVKVDPLKMSLDGITTTQLEEIVDGWMKFITKTFRDVSEKVSNYSTTENGKDWRADLKTLLPLENFHST